VGQIIGADFAPSLGMRKNFTDQNFRTTFLGTNFHLDAENFDDLILVIDRVFSVFACLFSV